MTATRRLVLTEMNLELMEPLDIRFTAEVIEAFISRAPIAISAEYDLTRALLRGLYNDLMDLAREDK